MHQYFYCLSFALLPCETHSSQSFKLSGILVDERKVQAANLIPGATTRHQRGKMFSKTPPSILSKRHNEDPSIERPRKGLFGGVKDENDALLADKFFWFRILLPNGTTVELKMTELRSHMPIEEFIDAVKREYLQTVKRTGSPQPKTRINWTYADLHFTDADGIKIRTEVKFRDLLPNKWHILALNDGSAEPEAYEDMWDLTPDTDLLKELPDEYTFETALADLIDNSLQAVWSNRKGEKRLISVELRRNRISIFDTGPGMDGVNEKIVKWGKMGASMHREEREQAIGGKPPYLMVIVSCELSYWCL